MSRHDFDVVIVGSGFGGSVMAEHLAEKGMRVCLLERGKAYAPGDFPRSPTEMSRAFWDPSEKLQGIFNIWQFPNFGALISSGLGGGSLIYANVLLRRPKEWFTEEKWPIDYATLVPHYERVESVLKPTETPNMPVKGRALKLAADHMKSEWKPAPLAVSFGEPGQAPGSALPTDDHNLHGRTRLSCRYCGECNIGCNSGSKNSLDHNFLSLAKKHGADIRPRHEVKAFRRLPDDGYSIDYVVHRDNESSKHLKVHTMTCTRLVLAAGALGSTYLLLKNVGHTNADLPMLGRHFSTNGDFLSTAASTREKGKPRSIEPTRGPVITGYVDKGDYLIQDAAVPDMLAWLIDMTSVAIPHTLRLVFSVLKSLLPGNDRRDISAEVAGFFGPSEYVTSSLPLLGMGRDKSDGRMSLEKDLLQIGWNEASSKQLFDDIEGSMRDVSKALGGTYRPTPVWRLKKTITVHPLGGCPMGTSKDDGVVDRNGKVFGAGNLYVADGAVMPRAVGPNPSLTIAAISSHIAEGIANGG